MYTSASRGGRRFASPALDFGFRHVDGGCDGAVRTADFAQRCVRRSATEHARVPVHDPPAVPASEYSEYPASTLLRLWVRVR